MFRQSAQRHERGRDAMLVSQISEDVECLVDELRCGKIVSLDSNTLPSEFIATGINDRSLSSFASVNAS